MSGQGLRDHLKDHYAGQSLPADKVERLTGLVSGDRASATRVGERALSLSYALAACLALSLIGNAYLARQLRSARQELTGTRSVDARPSIGEPGDSQPHLVAIKAMADGCSYCSRIAPVFRAMERKYNDGRVLFVTMDATNDDSKRQARILADRLGLDWLAKDITMCCVIWFVDCRQREVLATLTRADQGDELDDAFERALEKYAP